MSVCYLIHFDKHYQHSQHYIGYAENLPARIKHHKEGTGARLLAVINAAGITWEVVRTWEGKDRTFERQLKNQNHAARLCPICNPTGWTRRMATTDLDNETAIDIPAAIDCNLDIPF